MWQYLGALICFGCLICLIIFLLNKAYVQKSYYYTDPFEEYKSVLKRTKLKNPELL